MQHDDRKVVELDSADFNRQRGSGGAFFKSRVWPLGYLDAIMAMEADIIVVSAHPEVIQGLLDRGVQPILVHPTLEQKDEYVGRSDPKGKNPEFRSMMSANFSFWLKNIQQFSTCRSITLQPGQFLADAVSQIVSQQ